MAGDIKSVNPGEQVISFVRARMPEAGLFAGQSWRTAAKPFLLDQRQSEELAKLGRVLLQFYRALNLLYRKSVEGKQPSWVSQWLDQGKPSQLIELQRSVAFKSEVPRIIRPDLLLTEYGYRITELDSVPGGIGLTAWLNSTYSEAGFQVIGQASGMLEGFRAIFGNAQRIIIVVSQEAATYRPEMEWIAQELGESFMVVDSGFSEFQEGDAIYRFFELFDLHNVHSSARIFDLAIGNSISLTPPPKAFFEEKMAFALLWNRNLESFWKQELGETFFQRMLELVPRTWIVDPSPLPPQSAYPGLELTNWQQLKSLSQKKRDFILKVSGFSAEAWGARGVYLGSDLSQADWSVVVDKALSSYSQSPYILQPFEKSLPSSIDYWDEQEGMVTTLKGRVRLCPYYFVSGIGDAARANLGGVLATMCPADKKILHGMTDAVLAPCSSSNQNAGQGQVAR